MAAPPFDRIDILANANIVFPDIGINMAKFIFLGEIWVLGKCFLQFIQYLHTLTQAYVIFIAVKDIFKISHLFILIGAVGFYNYLKKTLLTDRLVNGSTPGP